MVLNNIAWIEICENEFEEARDTLAEAINWEQRVLAIDPDHVEHRIHLQVKLKNLMKALDGLGDESGVAEVQRQIADLTATDPRFRALDERLAAVARGEDPHDNSERLHLAHRAYDTQRFVLAARLWGEALESDPKLADDRMTQYAYNAACAAALAGCGKGSDSPTPNDHLKVQLRLKVTDHRNPRLSYFADWTDAGGNWQSDKRLIRALCRRSAGRWRCSWSRWEHSVCG